MNHENMVLRTVYVDPDVADHLGDEALKKLVSAADLFREYLTTGIKVANAQPNLLEPSTSPEEPTLVLKTVYLDPRLDHKLRVEAFDSRTSKNDLIRRYVRIGIELHKASVRLA